VLNKKLLTMITIIIGIMLIGAFTACDDGGPVGGGDGSGDGTRSPVTYRGTANSVAYTLRIEDGDARAVLTPAQGDRYTLSAGSGASAKKSTGVVISFTGGVLTLAPSEDPEEEFTVTVSGTSITAMSGTITWDNGTKENAPGTFTTSGSGNGGDSEGRSAIRGIAYGDGRFVAVGYPPRGSEEAIAYSTDGVTWTAVTNHPFGGGMINGVAWGNGRFVAVGSDSSDNSMIAYSTDGVTWTAVTNTTFGKRYIFAIVWGNDKFVAAGRGMAYSMDGETWTAINAPPSGTIEYIGWGNGKFFVGTDRLAYSTDGINWTNAANNPFGAVVINSNTSYGLIYDFAWGNGRFVAVGSYTTAVSSFRIVNGRIAFSSDGVTWVTVEDSTFGTSDIRSVAWGNGKFVAGGLNGKMAYSTDGENWTAVADSTFGASVIYGATFDNAILDIVWGNDRFVAVGSRSKMAYSTDGVTWTAVADSAFR